MSLLQIAHVECVRKSAFLSPDSVRRLRQTDPAHRIRVPQFSFSSRRLTSHSTGSGISLHVIVNSDAIRGFFPPG